jgi:hypothetical protein
MSKRKVSKLSKKAKRELDSRQRNVWNINPATRVKPSGKLYSRKKKVLNEY